MIWVAGNIAVRHCFRTTLHTALLAPFPWHSHGKGTKKHICEETFTLILMITPMGVLNSWYDYRGNRYFFLAISQFIIKYQEWHENVITKLQKKHKNMVLLLIHAPGHAKLSQDCNRNSPWSYILLSAFLRIKEGQGHVTSSVKKVYYNWKCPNIL